jgi:hypothetical protein
MNIISSLLKWIGDTIGANPSTLATTSKTLVGAINELERVNIKEIKYMHVEQAKTDTDNVYLTASVPSGYKFLCWTTFGVLGSVDWAGSAYDLSLLTVRVWTGTTRNSTVMGSYLVYR